MGCTVVSSLPTVGSPGTVYLQESYTGETSEQYYTAYTGSHYELYNNNGEAAYRWSEAGSARKYSGKYWSCSCCGYGYITSESEWDECNDPNSWTSGTTGMNGYTSDSGYFEDEEDPDFTSQSICTISYVSDAADYFVSAKTSPYTEIQTFEYEPNLTVKDEEREITFTSNNPGQGQASFTLKYIVPKCVDRTQVYDFSKIEYNGGDVDCKTTKVSFTIEGETKFLEISQKPNEEGKYESGYTESSAYTVSEGTDYTVSYSPSDINSTNNDRVITVSITGIGKFAGKGGSFSYTQKKCTGGTGTTCTVTSISADKTTVGVSEPTSITVNGTGTCTLQWDSSDGCTTGSFASAVPGTYTICSCDDSSKCVTITVTGNSCTEGTEYQISVTANTIDKCATSGSLIVKERSRTVNADCSTSEWSSWADTTAYTAQYTPNITANETTAETNYSVTVTSTHDKDVTASDTFKQNAGPCSGDVYVFEWVDAISADETNSVSESETQTKTINLRQSNLRKERNIIL